MAGSYAYDGTLLDVAGQGAAVDGDWFELLHSGSTERTRSNVQVSVSMPAGTGTWVLEGRNGPNDSPIQLDTGTAAKTASYPRMRQMRLRWTAAAGLTARGSVSATLKNVTYTPFFVDAGPWRGGSPGYWPDPNGVTDSFNRADNAASLGAADTGQVWLALTGTWGISLNQAACTVHSSNDVAVVDPGKSDCTVTVITAFVANDAGVIVRATDANNFIRLIFDSGTTWLLQKCVAGGFTTIASAAGSNVNGDSIQVVLNGSSITAFRNGVQIFTATDAFNATATKHGLHAASTVPKFDNFSAA